MGLCIHMYSLAALASRRDVYVVRLVYHTES